MKLGPKIETAVSNLLKLLNHPKAEDKVALFSEIIILNNAVRKLERWITDPLFPRRILKKYLCICRELLKDISTFTKLESNNEELKNIFGWTDNELLKWLELKEETAKLELKLFESVKRKYYIKRAKLKKYKDKFVKKKKIKTTQKSLN